MYTIQRAKQDLEKGWIRDFSISPIDSGWKITIHDGSQRHISADLTTNRSEGPKCFKTLDSAVKCLITIGFEFNSLTGEIK